MHSHIDDAAPATSEAPVSDPVCGMAVDPSTAKGGQSEYRGTTYSFCNPKCKTKFVADPERFLSPRSAAPPVAGTTYVCPMDPEIRQDHPGACPKCGMALEPETIAELATRVEYTCPMHPQIVRSEPGPCPICGMALEPRTVDVAEPINHELVDMTRRMWVSAALALPTLVLAMSEMIPGQPVQHALGMRVVLWTQFVLSTPVVLWGAWPFFQRGVASVVNRHLNMFTLIAMGTGAAYGFSVAALLFPRWLPPSLLGAHGMPPDRTARTAPRRRLARPRCWTGAGSVARKRSG